jgi:predicted AAA+ superfamily ATPase
MPPSYSVPANCVTPIINQYKTERCRVNRIRYNQKFKKNSLKPRRVKSWIIPEAVPDFVCATKEELIRQCDEWRVMRNKKDGTVDWQFTAKDARIKLKHLYPSI